MSQFQTRIDISRLGHTVIYSISIIFVVGLPVCRRKSQTGQIAFGIVSEAL